ncbi:AfsR/SARP family transcriptional regulator [Streptomyces stramineus]|uniref:AfsR/SARP family transcriptional regulator n=1 Tax=Streptomyces stramineus TaxID=173861 RepID=A0ABP3KKZ4_9ACTN
MRFNLIGSFEIVTDDGRICSPSTPKICQTLALLLTRPNVIVTPAVLIRELWGKTPPRTAQTTVQTYIYQARRMLAAEKVAPPGRELLVTRSPGYLIQVEDEEVDTKVFERLVAQGLEDLKGGRSEHALDHLRQGLDLWRGPALSNVPAGEVLTGRIVHLEELRIRALELRIEAMNRLGRQRESIPELRTLVNDYPLHEWFHGQLISALHRSGRRAEALHAYRNLHATLDDELGIEPSPDIQRLQREVLSPQTGPTSVLPQRDRLGTAPLWTNELTG